MNSHGITIRECESTDLERLKHLWESLYEHQVAHGMVMTMAPDGFEKWKASLERLLGRFAVVLIAEADTGPVGFLAAKIRTPSPPFLSNPVGFVSEVFVAESQRGLHIGKRLMESVEQWFRGQDIQRIELQVIMDNTIARNSYRNWGWKEELVQMVRHLPPASEDS